MPDAAATPASPTQAAPAPPGGREASGAAFRGRVLYVARAPFVSGAERALQSMLRHLDRTRVQPGLVLGHENELVGWARSLEIPAWVVPLAPRSRNGPLPWWRSLRQLRRVIGEFEPDVLHANDVPSCQAASVLGEEAGVPRMVHVRWTITAAEMGWWARRGAESVLCISGWVRERLGETGGTPLHDANVDVLPDAVDWPAKPASDQPLFNSRGNGGGALRLGFAGQLIESKGLDLLFEAIARLPESERPALLIAGEDRQTGGQYQRRLQHTAARLGVERSIRWLGFLEGVGELYRQVDAVVCPSREEPLGLVPLEAAEFSLPALANNLGGFLETIEHGATGWLVDPTPEAWAAAIRSASDRTELGGRGRAARERTARLYSPMVYTRRLMEVYAGAMAKRE